MYRHPAEGSSVEPDFLNPFSLSLAARDSDKILLSELLLLGTTKYYREKESVFEDHELSAASASRSK